MFWFGFFWYINPLFHKLPMSLITKSSLQTWWIAKPLCYCWERCCIHQLCQHFVLWVPLYMVKKNKIHCAGKDAYICNTKSLYCATLKKGNSRKWSYLYLSSFWSPNNYTWNILRHFIILGNISLLQSYILFNHLELHLYKDGDFVGIVTTSGYSNKRFLMKGNYTDY